MKKTISSILVCVLLVGTLLSLASCEVAGFVFGKYSKTTSALGVEVVETYDFSLTEVTKTTVSKVGSLSQTSEETYKYKVGKNDDGERIISFTVETDNGSKTTNFSFNSGSDNDGSYIEIGGSRYYSAK